MKIFATADLHGRRTLMDKLRIAAEHADMLLICGDIAGIHDESISNSNCSKNASISERIFYSLPAAQRKDVDYLEEILSGIQKPSFYVLGNDDWCEADGQHYLKKTTKIAGVKFVPFELVNITPFTTNREGNENKLMYELLKLEVDHNTIVVGHAPPKGVLDYIGRGTHCGSRSVYDWICNRQPMAWFCGHIHEDYGSEWLGDTAVLNCTTDYEHPDVLRGAIFDTVSGEAEPLCI